MSEMTERVARVICVAAGDDPDGTHGSRGILFSGQYWTLYDKDARAAIEAMLEPTVEMTDAAYAIEYPGEPAGFDDQWRVAIQAALKRKRAAIPEHEDGGSLGRSRHQTRPASGNG